MAYEEADTVVRDAMYESEVLNCKNRMYRRTAAITKTLTGERLN